MEGDAQKFLKNIRNKVSNSWQKLSVKALGRILQGFAYENYTLKKNDSNLT